MRQTGRGCLCDFAYGIIWGLGAAAGRAVWRLLAAAWAWPAPRLLLGAALLALAVPWAVAAQGTGVGAIAAGLIGALGWHGLTGAVAYLRRDWAAGAVFRVSRAVGYAILAIPVAWATGSLLGLPAWGDGLVGLAVAGCIGAVSVHGLSHGGAAYAPRLGAPPRVRRLR